ncbi:hypothetical protein ACQPZA_35335 [Pseudonocardia xinjiangensis]|uniref:hypothetical protein n=1 Tax=Pseudonocardia xinjiangensis TaxID=75289 RepID=UPI003D9398B7
MTDPARDPWWEVVELLSVMPDVFTRLLVVHIDDGDGWCSECRTPGRGTAHVRHPCSLTTVATRARERWMSRAKSISGNVVPLRRDTVERVSPGFAQPSECRQWRRAPHLP